MPEAFFHDPKHGITIYQGDCLQVLAALPAESVDLIFADPVGSIVVVAALVVVAIVEVVVAAVAGSSSPPQAAATTTNPPTSQPGFTPDRPLR